MARLSILFAPDVQLKRRALPVEQVDGEVRRLMDDMLETMHGANGIGLAAPQVGVLKRIIVVDVARPEESPQPWRMANPEIVWSSDDAVAGEEGCLSLPEQYAEVVRPSRVCVRYLDHQNEMRELEASGLLAKCIQHEIDHLDGVLFVDHLTSLKRGIILRKLAKQKRQMATV
ncbi:MAG: peptide deformylase [Rhodospirillales bacterium]|jgi:peptide deformylase|nr:peptide deformylase [Rhodospirillales bacterium]